MSRRSMANGSAFVSQHKDGNGSGTDVNVRMWTPDPQKWTHMDNFRNLINEKYDLDLDNYAQLYRWSCDNYPQFWEEFWHYGKIVHSKPYDRVVDPTKKINEIPEWFTGARLNFAENLLRYGRNEKVALYATGEGQPEIRTITFGQLRTQVGQYAAAMRAMGLVRGDRVAGFMPNCFEAVVAMLAAASIGAIWSSTSPDFGITGVLERFAQIGPKLLFSVASVVYNGKRHDHLSKVVDVVKGLAQLQRVVIVPFVVGDRSKYADLKDVTNGVWLEDFLLMGVQRDGTVPKLVFEQVPFNHPLYIMYSSGTTGAPKCMVHSVGGTLIQHLKEYVLHGNTTANDVVLYYTTTGWMMWNWLVSALAVGASVVLYDGSPFANDYRVLWDLVDTLKITVFGTGAKWLSVMEDNGINPIETHSLDSLHTILSTGSPLKPQSYDYVYSRVKRDVLLGSIAGGTDIIASFMGHTVTLPVYRGEIQGPLLAMAIECWSNDGNSVLGERGELVCVKPHPSMPTHFWNDPDGIKYKKAYFSSAFRGVWYHGDFCLINPTTGGLVVLGRSDGTLNPNGVRFGSAEIYNIVETFEEIEDSLCVAQRKQNGEDERVILFLKMIRSSRFCKELVQELQATIRTRLSARHVPNVILEIRDIPYTINGKKVEVAVREIISGGEVKNRSALRNPESLRFFENIPQLHQS